jgi:hypothetical protein
MSKLPLHKFILASAMAAIAALSIPQAAHAQQSPRKPTLSEIEVRERFEIWHELYEQRECAELDKKAANGDAKAKEEFDKSCSITKKLLDLEEDAIKAARERQPVLDPKFTLEKSTSDKPVSAEPVVVVYGRRDCVLTEDAMAKLTEALGYEHVVPVELADKEGNALPGAAELATRLGLWNFQYLPPKVRMALHLNTSYAPYLRFPIVRLVQGSEIVAPLKYEDPHFVEKAALHVGVKLPKKVQVVKQSEPLVLTKIRQICESSRPSVPLKPAERPNRDGPTKCDEKPNP